MSYWGNKPVYQQVIELMDEFPKLSRKELLAKVARPKLEHRTNPPRPRLQGSTEVARRKRQIAKGFIKTK